MIARRINVKRVVVGLLEREIFGFCDVKFDVEVICLDEGLKITCETNLIETDYLDVKFNIQKSKYFPNQKNQQEEIGKSL